MRHSIPPTLHHAIKMAASSIVGGHVCEFIDPVSEDFRCKECKHVARKPNLISCCGETFCQACITQVHRDNKPCPACETANFSLMLNKKYHKRILNLRAHCTMKDRGCEWTGKLEGLDAHLNTDTDDCQYADVSCPDCTQQVQKRNVATHLSEECPKRDYNCRYCGFTSTYEVVSNDHWPVCEQYPVPCPNRCGLTAIERCSLQVHLQVCPQEVIECEFQHAGCNETFVRQDLEKHMEQNTQNHLVLMSVAMIKIKEQLREKDVHVQEAEAKITGLEQDLAAKVQLITAMGLQIQTAEAKITKFQQQLEEKDQRIPSKIDQQFKGIKQQLRQKDQQVQQAKSKITELQQKLERFIQQNPMPPCQFILPNFSHQKTKDEAWISPVMSTHLGGCMFCIGVNAYGTHVAAWLNQVEGEFDAQLHWPVKCTITLQLLNQHRDYDHITMTKEFELKRPTEERLLVDAFSNEFVSHEDLGWDAQKQTQYLKDDCLHFRVTRVRIVPVHTGLTTK